MNKKILIFILGIGIVYILIVLTIFLCNKGQKKEVLPAMPKIKDTESRGMENKKPDIDKGTSTQEIEREPYQEGPLVM